MATQLDGSWTVHLAGYPATSTDDLTLDELEMAEKACGVPYTHMDPHVSVRIARALFAVTIRHAGASEDEALRLAAKLPVKALHGAFQYQPATYPAPAVVPADGQAPDPPPLAPTSVAG